MGTSFWVIAGIVYLLICFWGWAIVRVGAEADRRIEEWIPKDDEGA